MARTSGSNEAAERTVDPPAWLRQTARVQEALVGR